MIYPLNTAMLAIAIAVLVIVLAMRVSMARQKSEFQFGDGGNEDLQMRVRTHANLLENAPLFLILLGLLEGSGQSQSVIPVLAISFFVLRLTHVFALTSPRRPPAARAIGAIGTQFMFLVTALLLAASIWG